MSFFICSFPYSKRLILQDIDNFTKGFRRIMILICSVAGLSAQIPLALSVSSPWLALAVLLIWAQVSEMITAEVYNKY